MNEKYVILANDIRHYTQFLRENNVSRGQREIQFRYVWAQGGNNYALRGVRDYILVRLGSGYNRRIPFEMRAELERNAGKIWEQQDFIYYW